MSESALPRRIAESLLDIGAVQFAPDSPFTWSSGLKSPVYCDNRLTISYPAIRRRIRDAFQQVLIQRDIGPDLVVGTATAGIPHAAWLAEALDLPLVYVRSTPKGHGTGSQIEGHHEMGAGAVVIEDLVSTGGSSAVVVEALRREQVHVEAVLAIFSYDLEEARRRFEDLGIPLFTLTNFDEIFSAASARGEISDQTIKAIRSWRRDPKAWSERRG